MTEKQKNNKMEEVRLFVEFVDSCGGMKKLLGIKRLLSPEEVILSFKKARQQSPSKIMKSEPKPR